MRTDFDEYELDDDLERIDFGRVHSWLTRSYWSPGIALDKVKRAAFGSSLVVAAYRKPDDGGITNKSPGEQVGYLRVISDRATFAWIADVYVDEEARGHGIATAMLKFALDHPEHQGLRRWVLATKDAHPVYAGVGFAPLPEPYRWMIHYPKTGSTER